MWNTKVVMCNDALPFGATNAQMVLRCMDYFNDLKENGVNIVAVNNSYAGFSYDKDLHKALEKANELDILYVYAGTNHYKNMDVFKEFPANLGLDNTIVVGASDENDKLVGGYGKNTIDLAAPGVNIYTTDHDSKYTTVTGTSFAAPFVTGAIGLLASINPEDSAKDRKEKVLNSVDKISSMKNQLKTGGRLNLNTLLEKEYNERFPKILVDYVTNNEIKISWGKTTQSDIVSINVYLDNQEAFSSLDVNINTVVLTELDSNREYDVLVKGVIEDGEIVNISQAAKAHTTSSSNEVKLPYVQAVLTELFQSTNGSTWNNNTSWTLNDDVCSWVGITCAEDKKSIIGINLSNNNLNGKLPESLFNIETLKSLDLSNNNLLTGEISKNIKNLVSLSELNLKNDSFYGELPLELVSLPNFSDKFMLDGNYLTATNERVREILDNTYLGGAEGFIAKQRKTIPLSQRSALEDLYEGLNGSKWTNSNNWNGLVGTECNWYGITCEDNKVVGIDLSNNNLNGYIPETLYSVDSLKALNVSSNSINGKISQSIERLQVLEKLNLSKNNIGGEIPLSLGELKKLKEINLSSNNISGLFPTTINGNVSLQKIDFSDNRIDGKVPNQIKYLRRLTRSGLNFKLNSLEIDSSFNRGLQYLHVDGLKGFTDTQVKFDIHTPEGFFIEILDANTVELHWDRVTDVDGYNIYYNGRLAMKVPQGTTKQRMKISQPQYQQIFAISSTSGDTESTKTGDYLVQTKHLIGEPSILPNKPLYPVAFVDENNILQILWKDDSTGENGFTVNVEVNGQAKSYKLDENATQLEIKNPIKGQEYTVSITSNRNGYVSDSSEIVKVMIPEKDALKSNEFEVKWTSYGGRYFFFNNDEISKALGHKVKFGEKFNVKNKRTGKTLNVVVWDKTYRGRPSGEGHGRVSSDPRSSEWKTGDIIEIIKK